MIQVGYRPIVWHLMKYYAHFGHKEFILCLGHRADVIKNYFLNYDECISNDFVLSKGGRDVRMLASDIDDWKITFVDTGIDANVGERLLAVREHVGDDPVFMANYADGLCDVPIPQLIEHHASSGKIASFIAVTPAQTFHTIRYDGSGQVLGLLTPRQADLRINGGFFVLSNAIFNYLGKGRELVLDVFDSLIAEGQLTCYRHDGFWACMDTFKEKMVLDELVARGTAPWQIWKSSGLKRSA
jgi:glucose-1-phosphate cytidylyltransferase